eukprot:tig00000555_g2143.t1
MYTAAAHPDAAGFPYSATRFAGSAGCPLPAHHVLAAPAEPRRQPPLTTEELLHRTKRHRTMPAPPGAGPTSPSNTSPPQEIDSHAFAAAALDVLDQSGPRPGSSGTEPPPLPFASPFPFELAAPSPSPPPNPPDFDSALMYPPPPPRWGPRVTPSAPLPAFAPAPAAVSHPIPIPAPAPAHPAAPAHAAAPGPDFASAPAPPPEREAEEGTGSRRGEEEEVLALAADLAVVQIDRVEPALAPDVGTYPAAIQMSEGTMQSVATALQLTRAELARRSVVDYLRSPAVPALNALEAFMAELDAIPEGPDGPPPPARRRPLFCVEATDPPAMRLPPPLKAPRNLNAIPTEEALLAQVEKVFAAIDLAPSGPERLKATEHAAKYLCCAPAVASSLIATRRGRVHFRLRLAQTRVITGSLEISLAAVAALKAVVVKSAMRHLRMKQWTPADADAALIDCRHVLDVVETTRPSLRAAPCDLFLLPFADALHILGLARDLASRAEGRRGARRMLAETLTAIGDQHLMEGDFQTAVPLLFEAWSATLEAGLSPSRLEARVILLLVEAHVNDNLAFELAERYTETDDDAVFEARARFSLGRMAMVGAQLEEARGHFARIFEITRRLPWEERLDGGTEVAGLGHCGFAAIRAGRLYEGILMWRDCLALVDSAPEPASPALDIMSGTHKGFGRVASYRTYLRTYRLMLLVSTIFARSSRSVMSLHIVCALGELYARAGQRRRAALCFARAAAALEELRDAFPPEHPRCRRVHAALAALRETPNPTGAPAGPAGRAPPPDPPSPRQRT